MPPLRYVLGRHATVRDEPILVLGARRARPAFAWRAGMSLDLHTPSRSSAPLAARGDAAEEVPLGAYTALMVAFTVSFGTTLRALGRRGALPKAISARDIALLGFATHRMSRIITRDRIATPLRAPFTEYEGSRGAGEVSARPRGRGLRQALGRLLTCQYCAGPWIAAALVSGLLAKPRTTRVIASTLAVVTVSDFLNQAYARARQAS